MVKETMKYLIAMIVLCLLSFKNIVFENENCKKCIYKGGIGTAMLDKVSGNYKIINSEIGKGGLTLDIDSCKTNENLIELKGTVFGRMPKNGNLFIPVANILIIEIAKRNRYLVPKDTLDITNKAGLFKFKTKKIKGNFIIIKYANDSVGTIYSLIDFRSL